MTDKHQAGGAITFNTLQQAAEWFALLRSEDLSENDRIGWQKWLSENAEHRRAWERVESVSRQFDALIPSHERSAAVTALDAASRVGNQRRRALKMLTLVCTVGAVTWTTSRIAPVQQAWLAFSSDYATSVGETRNVVLADGTRVWLNTSSALNVHFKTDLRSLFLRSGEILIDTAVDPVMPARPFVVETSQGRLRALGTRFTVRQLDGTTQLNVYDGAVEISPAKAPASLHIIKAGEQVFFAEDKVESPRAADPANEIWTKGVLFANDLSLGEFIVELSRYHQGYLGCSPDVADLRVVGAYPLHDLNKTFAMLESALPITVKATFSWWISVQPR